MKYRAPLILFIFLAGCVPVKNEYYLPTAKEYQFEGFSCGYSPFGGYNNNIAAGIKLGVTATTKEGNLWLTFQFVIDEGHNFRFQSNTVILSSAKEAERREKITSGSGYSLPSIDPTIVMEGKPPKLYIANLMVPAYEPEKFTLVLPTAEVDSEITIVPPIEFGRVVKSGVMTCIQ